jgi:cytochrome c oxidase cbb3-type subunit 4
MSVSHDDMVWLAQSVGLFYLVGLSVIVVAYVYWPSNKKRFEKAAEAILHGEDRPWR